MNEIYAHLFGFVASLVGRNLKPNEILHLVQYDYDELNDIRKQVIERDPEELEIWLGEMNKPDSTVELMALFEEMEISELEHLWSFLVPCGPPLKIKNPIDQLVTRVQALNRGKKVIIHPWQTVYAGGWHYRWADLNALKKSKLIKLRRLQERNARTCRSHDELIEDLFVYQYSD